jgi:hypothetical protein
MRSVKRVAFGVRENLLINILYFSRTCFLQIIKAKWIVIKEIYPWTSANGWQRDASRPYGG